MSQLTLRNHTLYAAEFVVNEGHKVIARVPAIAPGAQVGVSSTEGGYFALDVSCGWRVQSTTCSKVMRATLLLESR